MSKSISRREVMLPLESALRNMVDDFFNHDMFESSGRFFDVVKQKAYPKLNLYYKDDNIVIEASVPGTKKENIQIDIHDDLLTISGSYDNGACNYADETQSWYLREISRAEFSRSVKLAKEVVDGLNGKEIDAKMEDGLLTIRLPFKIETEKEKSRRIEVK